MFRVEETEAEVQMWQVGSPFWESGLLNDIKNYC